MNTSRYYAAGIGAYVIWGFFSFILIPLASYPSLDILFYRVFMCTTLMLIISVLFRTKVVKSNYEFFLQLSIAQQRSLLLQLAGGGLFLTGNWFFFIYVVNHISVQAASFAYLVCPILTTLLSFTFLNEKLNRNQWIAVIMSAISCIILSFNHVLDVCYSLIIALFFALYIICQPKQKGLDKFLILTIQVICSAVLLLPFYPFSRGTVPASASFYTCIFIIAVLFTILPLWLNLYALKGLRSSALGILLYINPLMNFALAILYYKEKITSLQALAYFTIFISVVLFNIRVRTTETKAQINL